MLTWHANTILTAIASRTPHTAIASYQQQPLQGNAATDWSNLPYLWQLMGKMDFHDTTKVAHVYRVHRRRWMKKAFVSPGDPSFHPNGIFLVATTQREGGTFLR